MDVVKKLNKLRVSRNISVYKLAELTGINQSTLANTFSRGVVPSIGNLEKILNALGSNMSNFFSNESDEVVYLDKKNKQAYDRFMSLPEDVRDNINELVLNIKKTR
ncbi:MAG: helix-turn-helix transcriptional regulator [Gammaproteobacteria bacterium]|nr:helix-turn-helix transcriptional regulator [Gammaproteobacteria bacterium]